MANSGFRLAAVVAPITMLEYNQVVGNLTVMANGLIDLIRQRRLLLYPSDELRLSAAQTVVIESSRGLRLGKTKQANRVDTIVALAMACVAAIQKRGLGPMRIAHFGSSPVEALAELFGTKQHDEDLPCWDVGFTTPAGRLLRQAVSGQGEK
jgi:hypothetical protein